MRKVLVFLFCLFSHPALAVIAASNLTNSGSSNVSQTVYTTASISPTANALVIVSVASNIASSAVPTVTGASGTWVQIGTSVDSTAARRVTMFRDLSASPGSGAITITFGVTQSNCTWSIDQFTGVDTSGTDGSGAIVQFASNSTTSGVTTSFTVTLSALGSANNAAYGYVRQNSAAQTITKGSSFTELAQTTGTATESEWALNQTAVNWTWVSQTVVSVGAAVEIKAATAAAVIPEPLLLRGAGP